MNIIQENNWVITTKKGVRVTCHHFAVMYNGYLPSMDQTLCLFHFPDQLKVTSEGTLELHGGGRGLIVYGIIESRGKHVWIYR